MAVQLAHFLEPSSICLQVDLPDRDDVITLLGRRLEARGLVKDSFAAAAIAREREMPTGLPLAEGLNVAVPHTDPEHVLRTGLALATLAHPAYFGSMDDPETMLPVRVVIVMALSERKAQIEMLQSIADLFQNREVLDALIAAKSPEEVLATLGRTPAGAPNPAPVA